MKITKSYLRKIIKEEIENAQLNEALDRSLLKNLPGISSNDQNIRNDIEAAADYYRTLVEPGVLLRMPDDSKKAMMMALRDEIKKLNQRHDIASRLKNNKFSDVNNLKNLELLTIHLDGLFQSIRDAKMRVPEEFALDPSRED
jgi:hypothetical protein